MIAEELLDCMEREEKNPFIEEKMWKGAEIDTVQICHKYIEKGDRKILDVGVGTGRLLSYKCFDNMQKYGIDISLEMAKLSSSRNIVSCVGNVESLPFEDNYFDVILCTDVLEHVVDLYKTVTEIYRVLKADGLLIVRVPLEEEMEGYMACDFPYKYSHLRMFSKSSLIIYLTRAFEFKCLETKGTSMIMQDGKTRFVEIIGAFVKDTNINRKKDTKIEKIISKRNKPVICFGALMIW